MKIPSPKPSHITPPDGPDDPEDSPTLLQIEPSIDPPDLPQLEEVLDTLMEELVSSPLSEEGSIFEVSYLDPEVAEKLNFLKSCSGLEEFPQELESFLKGIELSELENSSLSELTTFLSKILSSEINPSALEKDAQLNLSQSSQLYSETESLCSSAQLTLFHLATENSNILSLMQRMQKYITHIGFTFLVYLSESDSTDFSSYFEFTGPENSKQQLVKDLKIGVLMEVDTFFRILPSLYRECSEQMVGNVDVFEVVVTNLDPSNLYKLVCGLTMQEFSIFAQAKMEQILLATLDWETTDQYLVWQLIEAEGVPVSDILPIIPHLTATSDDQFESLTQLILYLKSHSPEGPILKSLLTSLHESPGVQSLLLHWTRTDPETLARALTSMVHIVASEDTDLDMIVLAVKHISSIQGKNEFQAVLRDADLIKCLLDLFESNDILKDEFDSFFTSLQQTKSSRRKSPQKGELAGVKRSHETSKVAPRYPKKKRRMND